MHFLALLLLALPSFARATLRLARRCRSFSSFLRPLGVFPVAGSSLSRRPQPPTTPASSCRSDSRGCVDALPGPLVARAPVLRPSNHAAGKQPYGWQGGAAASSPRSCVLSAFSLLWLALRCLGVPSPQRHRHLLAAPTLAATSTHFLALLLLALPSFARATLRLARRCRSSSSFSSSRTRSCVTHGRRAPVVGSPLSPSPTPSDAGIFLPLRPSRLRRRTSWPSCCSRSRSSPEQPYAGKALPLLLFVLFLAHAFLREARQEGPLVPPTLPWQVELSEGPPPAPPLLRRRPHNKTHFPLHRLS